MKNLSYYKSRYRSAKKNETKAKVLNGAMLNLSNEDQKRFISWQVKFMNNRCELSSF